MAKKKAGILDGFEELTSEMLPEDVLGFECFKLEESNLDDSIDSHHKFSKFKTKGETNKWAQAK